MKFYRVHSQDDPAQSDTLFATAKERAQHIKEFYGTKEEQRAKGWDVITDEIEVEGPLTKAIVCRIYSLAIR